MVDSRIQLRSLSTGELTGIINIYPWFGGARKELCRRLAREGGASEEQFADMALHIPAREKIYRLLREPVVRREVPEKPAAAPSEAAVVSWRTPFFRQSPATNMPGVFVMQSSPLSA